MLVKAIARVKVTVYPHDGGHLYTVEDIYSSERNNMVRPVTKGLTLETKKPFRKLPH